MKKLLWTIITLVLLLGVGFLYVVKNPDLPISQKILSTMGVNMATNGKQKAIDPSCTSYFDGCNTCMVSGGIIEGCTKMYCQEQSEPKCLEYTWTGMDLTNCVSYFDGCNNCSVKNGRPDACTEMYCETPSEPKCNEYTSGTENTETVGIANPASTFCVNNGGTLKIVDTTGGQVGMCTLSDGSVCEERAYARGECKGQSEDLTMCTMEYAPVCASVAVQCIKAPCDPIEQTFGNRCMMNSNKLATFLYEGECKTK